jgi:hypothetical protein
MKADDLERRKVEALERIAEELQEIRLRLPALPAADPFGAVRIGPPPPPPPRGPYSTQYLKQFFPETATMTSPKAISRKLQKMEGISRAIGGKKGWMVSEVVARRQRIPERGQADSSDRARV